MRPSPIGGTSCVSVLLSLLVLSVGAVLWSGVAVAASYEARMDALGNVGAMGKEEEGAAADVDMPPPHVLVVGGGLAGLSAALTALEGGARVTLAEREGRLGGNSAKATSGINAVGSRGQHEHLDATDSKVVDSVDLFIADTMKSGRGRAVEKLVHILAEESASAAAFVEDAGVELSVLSQLGGHSAPRTHREPPRDDGRPRPIGYDIVSALKRVLESEKYEHRLTIHVNARAQRLLVAHIDGMATTQGVEFEKLDAPAEEAESSAKPVDRFFTIEADAVIMATGGFCADRRSTDSLLAAHRPDLLGVPSTNGPWATGDGMRLASSVGAALVDMDQVQVHPTGFVDPKDPSAGTKFLAPEALRGSGALLMTQSGYRFVDELQTRDTVTGATYKYCALSDGAASAEHASLDADDVAGLRSETATAATSFMVVNDAVVKIFGETSFGFYHRAKKFFVAVEGVNGLAAELGADASTVRDTLSEYTAAAGAGRDKFGKSVFPVDFADAETERLYVARITPVLHYSMGGIQIDEHARVRSDDVAKTFARFYAAGEVTGGVHGANRLGGNSLLECVVFGRIAARAALTDHQAHFESAM